MEKQIEPLRTSRWLSTHKGNRNTLEGDHVRDTNKAVKEAAILPQGGEEVKAAGCIKVVADNHMAVKVATKAATIPTSTGMADNHLRMEDPYARSAIGKGTLC